MDQGDIALAVISTLFCCCVGFLIVDIHNDDEFDHNRRVLFALKTARAMCLVDAALTVLLAVITHI